MESKALWFLLGAAFMFLAMTLLGFYLEVTDKMYFIVPA